MRFVGEWIQHKRKKQRDGGKIMDTEFFTQRIQCSRTDKQDCLGVVWQLMELATIAQENSLLDMEKAIQANPQKYSDVFLRKAVSLIVDSNNMELIKKTLYNYIYTSNYSGPMFLKGVVITETILAIQQREDLDHIFLFLVPSYFGLDFESQIIQLFDDFKHARNTITIEEEIEPEDEFI